MHFITKIQITVLLLLTTFSLLGQDRLVTKNGEEIKGDIKSTICFLRQCDSLKVTIVEKNGKSHTFSGYEIDYYISRKEKYIVRSYEPLADFYQSYHLIVDGTILVFESDLSLDHEIYCLELGNGMFFPVTEKIYNKWILPYMLEKETFRIWHEKHGHHFVYPTTKKDKVGGRKQNKVNRFIVKVTTMYNIL